VVGRGLSGEDTASTEAPRLISRREALKASLALPLALAAPRASSSFPPSRLDSSPPLDSPSASRTRRGLPHQPDVVVVGAGAFGGWTALHLLRRGARVTLFDAWGAGNSRASSGGETRVIRAIYGGVPVYVEMVVRSFALWRESEAAWRRRLYRRTGALWMFGSDDAYARSSLPLLQKAGLEVQELSLSAARQRYEQVDFSRVRAVFFEREAGYLTARQACEVVREAFVAEGGEYRTTAVKPGPTSGGAMSFVSLDRGRKFKASAFVFACGPWLGGLFPDVVGELIRATRQEEFFFGVPPGDHPFREEVFPVWVDFDDRVFYGIPGNDRRGFKIADDTHGEIVDPTSLERIPSPEGLARARERLASRFPGLARAPLVEARVCQYENSPDGDFIIDRHPSAVDVWIVGGGSGHGFKMGPAVGEHVAKLVLGEGSVDPAFSLSRFAGRRESGERVTPGLSRASLSATSTRRPS
jgi:glycine/D-amino acid oxidase-like deaminating enzyme